MANDKWPGRAGSVVRPGGAGSLTQPVGAGMVTIDGVDLVLAPPDDHDVEWLDFDACVQRLSAAWLARHHPPTTSRARRPWRGPWPG